MKLCTFLMTGALALCLVLPAAAETPDLIVAQANTKAKKKAKKKAALRKQRRAKRKARQAKAVRKTAKAKKAAPPTEVVGEVMLERGKKGALKAVFLVTGEGEKLPVVLDRQARKMAALGGRVTVKARQLKRKKAVWLRVVSHVAAPVEQPEVEVEDEAPAPADAPPVPAEAPPVPAEAPPVPADAPPAPVDVPPPSAGDAPSVDDDAPVDDDDLPSDDAPGVDD